MRDIRALDLEPLSRTARCAVVAASVGRVRQTVPIGDAEADTAFRIASLTKPLTAVTAVLATRRAGLTLETPVLDVLTDLRGDWRADPAVTIGQILSQTSGLASTVSADDVSRLGNENTTLVEAARLVVRAGNTRPPGERWEYYNGNYFLAGAAISALTGRTYEEALDDLVLRPWRLTATSFTLPRNLARGVDAEGPLAVAAYPRGRRPSGGLISNAEDLLTFGEHLLDNAALLTELQTARTSPEDPMTYGLGWAIGPSGQMFLNGRLAGYRAALIVVPAYDLTAVTLAADSRALPAQARLLSDLQHDLTGDDLTEAIDSFAA